MRLPLVNQAAGFEQLDKAAVVLLEGDCFGQWLVAACNIRPEHAHMLVVQEVTGSTLFSSPDVAAFLARDFSTIPAGRQEAIVAKVAALKGASLFSCPYLALLVTHTYTSYSLTLHHPHSHLLPRSSFLSFFSPGY